jgi:hypothetical protein
VLRSAGGSPENAFGAGMHEQTREASLPRGLSANITKDVHRTSILDARGGMSPAGPPTPSPRDPWSVVTRVAGTTTALVVMVTEIIRLF